MCALFYTIQAGMKRQHFSVGRDTRVGCSQSGDISGEKVKPYVPKRLRDLHSRQPQDPSLKIIEGRKSDHNASPTEGNSTTEKCSKFFVDSKTVSSRVPSKIKYNIQVHNKPISCIRLNERMHNVVCSASLNGELAFMNLKYGTVTSYIRGHTEGIKDARFTEQGNQILSVGFDKRACIHDVSSEKEIFQRNFTDYVTSALYNPKNENIFLAGMFSSGIVAVDIRSGQIVRKYKTQTGQIHDLLFLPDQKKFLSAAEVQRRQCVDKAIICWDFDSGGIMSNQIYQDPYPCTALRLHPNGTEFLAQSAAGYIAIFDVCSPYRLNKYKRFEGHQTAGYAIGFSVSPDGNLLASGDNEGSISVYDYHSSKLVRRLTLENQFPVTDVFFHPSWEGGCCASTWDGRVVMWD